MNRIDQKFRQLRQQRKKAFIAFITAGDPSLKATEELVAALEAAGVDLIELGVPFSDPLADGPTIQASSQRALNNGASLNKILESVKRIRRRSQIPIALMSYYNPIFHQGEAAFIAKAKKAGVDGVIIPDLPPEEAGVLTRAAKKEKIATVFFIAPTTTRARMAKIAKASSGFIYYVSLAGTTGARARLPKNVIAQIKLAKKLTKKPVCVGFGVSTRQQVRSLGKAADGVIVGSAIVKEIERNRGKRDLVKRVSKFVKILKG
jgi:tryptophan synthase alpha chain